MQQDWTTVDFKLGVRAEAKERLAVVDFSSRMALMELLGGFPKAKEALSAELKKLKKDEDAAQPKKLAVGFEGKGGLTALVLTGDCSAFSAQTSLRKSFLPALFCEEESKEVQLSLRGLKDREAERFLNWAVSLAMISRYRAPVFGKKAKDQKPLGKLTLHIDTSLSKKQAESIIEEARILGFANNQVRHLAELPSNVLNPATYRERA